MRQFILISLLISLISGIQAQVVNSNQVISMTGGVKMTIVKADVLNDGSWINEGTLNIENDWTNNGTYQSSNGLFNLNGLDQNLNGNFSPFSDLSVDGNGVKAFSKSLNILGKLHLISGLLVMEESASLSVGEGGTIIGGDEQSYIVGKLSLEGSGDLFYPTGTIEKYLPVTLFGAQEDGGYVDAKAIEGSPGLNTSLDLSAVSTSHFWEIETSSSTNLTGLQLPLSNETFILEDEYATIAYSNGIDDFSSLGDETIDGNLSNGNITSLMSIQSGIYAIGEVRADLAPPLTIVNVVTPNNDGKHDYLRIDNVEFYPNNKVEIFTRSGQQVFRMSGYNNTDKVFSGRDDSGRLLVTGNYFYTIRLGNGKSKTGFIYVKI